MTATVISIIALLFAGASALYAWRAARAAEQSAQVAKEQDRRARSPRLAIRLAEQASAAERSVIYYVINEGLEDLDTVTIHKPETQDGIDHPVAAAGEEWADVASLGALKLGVERGFKLSIGTSTINGTEPDYRVRILSTRGPDRWEQVQVLEVPRHPLGIY